MRLRGFEINAFGRLADFSAADLVDAPVVVLLGDNESGKTTFFEFVTTALHGFKPARRENHPYDPWSGAVPEGALDLRLADGTDLTVRRRLRGNPDGRLVVGDTEEKIANHPLRCVGRIEREVYRSLHALSITEADQLGQPVWDELEERLLGGAAFPFLRPARSVAADLETQANALWRTDRRGKPRSKEIEAEQRALKKRREEAVANDRRVREIQAEKSAAEQRLAEVRDEGLTVKAHLELAGRITAAREDAERLEKTIERHSESAELDSTEQRLLDNAAQVRALGEEGQAHRADSQALASMQTALERATRRVTEGAPLFDTDLDDTGREQLDALSEDGLQRAFAAADEAARPCGEAGHAVVRASSDLELLRERAAKAPGADEIAALETRVRELERLWDRERAVSIPSDGGASAADRIPAWLMGALALALLVAAALVPAGGAALLGAGVLVALVAVWLFVRSPATPSEPARIAAECARTREDLGLHADADVRAELQASRGELNEAQRACVPPADLEAAERTVSLETQRFETAQAAFDRARDDALARLHGIPIADVRLERLDAALVAALMRQRDALRAEHEARADLDVVNRRIDDRESRAAALAEALGRETGEAAFGEVSAWGEELSALTLVRGQEAARQKELPQLEEELASRQEAVSAAVEELRSLGIEGAHAGLDTVTRMSLEQRRGELEDEEHGLVSRAGALDKEEELLSARDGVDQVDGEIAAADEELATVACERDRLVLLANVLREAHRRYRERHQPDVFRRASEYLRIVTDGRYESLEVADEEGAQHLEVRATGEEFPLRVGPPLSRGTREQIHLSIRLALADHVDGDEPLPLVLDELFVNWDPTRTGRGLGVLRELGERRQILLMTCHPDFAERARLEAGAVVVRMPAGGAR